MAYRCPLCIIVYIEPYGLRLNMAFMLCICNNGIYDTCTSMENRIMAICKAAFALGRI